MWDLKIRKNEIRDFIENGKCTPNLMTFFINYFLSSNKGIHNIYGAVLFFKD